MGIALAVAIGAARAQTGAPASRPEFEVASIKPNNGIDERPGMQVRYGGHVTIHAMTVRTLIGAAYDIDESFQVSGGPRWIETERYDIVAQAAPNVATASFEWWRPVLQSLLADRFKLALHRETKELPVYELVAAKSGIKIAPLKEGPARWRIRRSHRGRGTRLLVSATICTIHAAESKPSAWT